MDDLTFPFPIYIIVLIIMVLWFIIDRESFEKEIGVGGLILGAILFSLIISISLLEISLILFFIFISIAVVSGVYIYRWYEEYELLRKKKLERMEEVNARRELKSKLESLKNRCNSWLEKNMDELKSITKESKSLKKQIYKREEYLENLVNEYYSVPRCSKCNTEKLYLIDINDLANGIELMCQKCSKKTWVHAKQDNIKNGHKYVTYLEEYFSLYKSGFDLNVRHDELYDEYWEIHDDRVEYKKNKYFDEIIEYEQRYNKNGSLKRGKSYHPLDPEDYSYESVLPKINFIFMGLEEGKREYIWLYSDSEEITSKDDDRYIPKAVQREVWRRDQAKCQECGSKENLEYDHIIPVSKNGSNTVRNIQLLCEKHNRSKSNKIG